MQSWQFDCVIPGAPIGKGRPRATKMGNHVRLYTPKRTADWERSSALIMRNAWMSAPSDALCKAEIVAVFPRPKRLLRKKDPEHRLWHGSKPDIDNVCKSVLDSLVMGGVIRDDTQVVFLNARSVYASKSEGPCVEVRLSSIDCDGPSG
jgi:Holliday junction resolvase RusA-like endonuclease